MQIPITQTGKCTLWQAETKLYSGYGYEFTNFVVDKLGQNAVHSDVWLKRLLLIDLAITNNK